MQYQNLYDNHRFFFGTWHTDPVAYSEFFILDVWQGSENVTTELLTTWCYPDKYLMLLLNDPGELSSMRHGV